MVKVHRAPVACVFVDGDSQIGDRLFYRYVGDGCTIAVFEWEQFTLTKIQVKSGRPGEN